VSGTLRAMRLACALLAIVACKGSDAKDPAPAPPVAPKPPPSVIDPWERIALIAADPHSRGPSTDLERAMVLAGDNHDAWRELRYKVPPPPLSAYAHGEEAFALLRSWAAAGGGLPATPRTENLGPELQRLSALSQFAAGAAGTREELAPASYLGTVLVTGGRNGPEVMTGVSLLKDVARKLDRLHEPKDALVVPELDLVRLLAIEALMHHRANHFVDTPEGKAWAEQSLQKLGNDTKEAVKDLTGQDPNTWIPDKAQIAAYDAFSLAALDGAQRGEPADVTLARARKAAAAAPAPVGETESALIGMYESLRADLEQLQTR
jgi:hypothetical protein